MVNHATSRLSRFDLERLVDSTTDVLVQFDRELRHTYVSASIEQVAGRPRADFIGRTNRQLGMRADLCDLWDRAILDVFQSGLGRTLRFSFPAPDGTRHFESTLSAVRDEVEHIVAVTAVVRDVTDTVNAAAALATSEERLRVALAAANAGAWDWDIRSGRITWSSENFALYGLDPAAGTPTYADWERCLHPEDLDGVNQAIRDAVEGRAPSYRSEFRVRTPSGQYRWLMGLGEVCRENGIAVRMCGINLDITTRRLTEQALAEATRNQEVFVATLAHELRNFTAPFVFDLAILERTHANDARTVQRVAAMHRRLGRIDRLIGDLLDLERIRSGRLEVRKGSVDLRSVIEAAIESCRDEIRKKQQELIVQAMPTMLGMRADETRLVQVFTNLIGNATKFTQDGGRIEVHASLTGHTIEVVVRDNGPGLEPPMLESVFDLFTQGNHERAGGLGVGLAIARRIVELHDGTIFARSDGAGAGTAIVVKLPYQPPDWPI